MSNSSHSSSSTADSPQQYLKCDSLENVAALEYSCKQLYDVINESGIKPEFLFFTELYRFKLKLAHLLVLNNTIVPSSSV